MSIARPLASVTRYDRACAGIADALELGLCVLHVENVDDPTSLRLVYANPAACAAVGLRAEDIVGRHLRDIFPASKATGRAAAYLEVALGAAARDLGEVEPAGGPAGRHIFLVRAFPLPDQCVGLSFTDATSLRAAEQRAVETLESMSDAFLTIDADWRLVYLNPRGEAMLECERADVIGISIWDLFPEVLGSEFDKECRRAVQDQVPVEFEAPYDPLGIYVNVRAYPVPAGLAVYFRDVTVERLRDARLRQTQRLEAIGRVTAGIAHDFNNLLTVIRGYATLGRDASDLERALQYFDEIDSAGAKAVGLTRQLLAFGRQTDLAPADVDLNDVVADLFVLLNHLLPSRIDLQFNPDAHAVRVFADRDQLEQIVLNLVVNSRDAIDEHGTITIRTGTEAPVGLVHDVDVPSGWLQVADTGSGIPEAVKPQIFDPFFSTKEAETGSGLGLATIYGIVSQSGGGVFVDSLAGVGTTMSIALPRAGVNT